LDRDFVKRYWFLTGLILLIPVGIMAPDAGLALKESGWVIPVFVGIMLGVAGFTMDTSSLVKQAANFRAVVPVLVSIYIFCPAAAYGLAKLLAPAGNQDFLPAMMIMAAQAGSLASAIALTMMSGGNRELALICTLVSNGLTFLLTPFILELSIGTQVEFPVGKMMLRMVFMVLVPIAVGQLLRQSIWDKTEPIRPFIRIVPQFIILMFVYTGFASGAAQLQKDSDIVLRFLVACALLHVILLGLNFVISGALGFKWPERTAMILSGSQKTLPNGIYVWSNFFSANPYGAVPLVLYHLFQLLVDTLLVPKFEQKNPVSEDSISESVAINCHGDVED
jgi:sodium/bile acid cotransporter 7